VNPLGSPTSCSTASVPGNSTAKVTSLHGLTYASLASDHGEEVARLYGTANEAGIATLAALAAEHSIECELRRKPNHTYTEDPAEREKVEREVEAAVAAGVPASYTEETDLPYPVAAAVRAEDQLEFQPVKYIAGLADALDATGPRVFERTRAVSVSKGEVRTAAGARVRAGRVVVATHLPFLDRGLFFARTHPAKSYALSVRPDGPVPQGMYLSAESPAHSLRALPWDGGELLIVGGQGHEVGRGDPAESYRALERWARERFGARAVEHRWSAHDFISEDGLPFVGPLMPGSDRNLVLTGLRKWGYALATALAGALANLIAGRDDPLLRSFHSWRRPPLRSLPSTLLHDAEDGVHLVADRLRRSRSVEDLRPGEGRVVSAGLGQAAVHRDLAGDLHAVSARCTHLGCIVRWNGADGTWDCPCHGSRFEADGSVRNGPATEDLRPVDL
jgi:glycine/D-amino acid oxidase-like deaminating enzyme/nitrite reductase/ring-hydroxylating ferredoxin subunit